MRTRIATIAISGMLLSVIGSAEEQSASPADGFADDRVPLHTVVPSYPEDARKERVEGEVQVCFNVDRKGKTYRLAVRSSSHRMFERPSLKAVRQSTYQPLAKDAVVPGIKTCRTFRFFLDPIAIDKGDGSDESVDEKS